jgi:hypothetical protein
MNALSPIDPPKLPSRSVKSRERQPLGAAGSQPVTAQNKQIDRSEAHPEGFSFGETAPMPVKLNPAYIHRRLGLEAIAKLVTYSTLSVFGMVTLASSIGYNWSQRSKLQHLETELQEAKLRTEKDRSNFSRSFAPEAQQDLMAENSYKVAPDRLQIFPIDSNSNTNSNRSTPAQRSK